MSHKRHLSPTNATIPSSSKRPTASKFPSYLDSSPSSLPPQVLLICRLLDSTPVSSVESALSTSVVSPLSPSDVETVLKLSYSLPAAAVKFFRWASSRSSITPYSWNLAVDLLGKNRLFDAMWDAVLSMRSQSLLSLATFASVFSSYAAAYLPDLALKAFDDMQTLYAVRRDTAALNSLLSALCREGLTLVARDFLRRRQDQVPPDADSFAILLEGWETDRDARRARDAFDEMVEIVGWDPKNVAAYDSFLCTLMRGSGGMSDALRYLDILKGKRCYPGMKFFRNAMEEMVKNDDARGAITLWEAMIGRNGCYPDTKMYNSMISLLCHAKKVDEAMKYLDEMVVFGAFPDEKTYNVLLQYLLKGRLMRDAAAVFDEMVRNEFVPSEANCDAAIRVFLDVKDWEMGIKVWKCMVENGYSSEESGNAVVGRLKDLDRLPEACKLAEEMIDRRVKLNSATLTKLKTGLLKIGKGSLYDQILMKWKLR